MGSSSELLAKLAAESQQRASSPQDAPVAPTEGAPSTGGLAQLAVESDKRKL